MSVPQVIGWCSTNCGNDEFRLHASGQRGPRSYCIMGGRISGWLPAALLHPPPYSNAASSAPTTSATSPTTGKILTLYEYDGNSSNKFRNYTSIDSSLVPSGGDGVSEYASADYSTTGADADAFDTDRSGAGWKGRGAARGGGSPFSYPAVNIPFMRSAGVEKIAVQWPTTSLDVYDVAWVKNQADWLYFSGHGHHDSNTLRMIGDTSAPFSLNCQQLISNWSNCDIERAVIAGCSVLDIKDYNNNFAGSASPGEEWATLSIDKLLGYNAGAPGDPQDRQVVDAWLDGGASVEAWLDCNSYVSAWNACAIYDSGNTYRFWKYDWFLGHIVNEHKVTTYKSNGWALP